VIITPPLGIPEPECPFPGNFKVNVPLPWKFKVNAPLPWKFQG
jgi:hypothetical protein